MAVFETVSACHFAFDSFYLCGPENDSHAVAQSVFSNMTQETKGPWADVGCSWSEQTWTAVTEVTRNFLLAGEMLALDMNSIQNNGFFRCYDIQVFAQWCYM